MSSLEMKDVLISLLPKGALWDLDEEGDLYKLLDGSGDNHQTIFDFMAFLPYVREPKQTAILSDLEKEYGLLTNSALTEQERRDYLHGVVYAPPSTGTWEYLQDQLIAAGFDVQVHVNSPAVDPGLFSAGAGGEMVTNNILYDRTFDEARLVQALWGYVFFIGGDAVRDTNGALLTIVPYIVPDELKALFRELVLKYKPEHSWCIALMNDADYFQFAPSDNIIVDAPRGFADDDQTSGGYWSSDYLGDMYIIDDITYDLVLDGTDYLIEE